MPEKSQTKSAKDLLGYVPGESIVPAALSNDSTQPQRLNVQTQEPISGVAQCHTADIDPGQSGLTKLYAIHSP